MIRGIATTAGLALALSAGFYSSTADAEEALFNGFYLKGEAGASFGGDTGPITVRDDGGTRAALDERDSDVAAVVGLGAGVELAEFFRGELLFDYRTGYGLDTELTEAIPGLPAKADIDSYSLFLNAYFDVVTLDLGGVSLTPYLGGGVGVAINDTSDVRFDTAGFTAIELEGDTTTQFAWNAAAGLGIGVTESLTLEVGYRYVDLGRFKSGVDARQGATTGEFQKGVKGDLTAHEALVALRYSF